MQPAKKITTDVVDLLTSQHREVDALFAKLKKEAGERSAAFIELADKLAAHATIEEKVFYPAVMARSTSDLLQQSVEEHLAIKRVLADMLVMSIDHDDWKAKLEVLEELVSHHAHEEEEAKLFPMIKKAMSDDQRAALGNECLVMFEDLLPSHPSRTVPRETAKAARLPSAS
jgi:hemerythrin superfamily protein